ncbi:LysR family transcriptional regulator [Elongatibacter sediminis]|uniref:LysR family transcriptional regulator n=1 Tax=Elongatibacter sediminis TaxID=3119006 RepID=A0AAW9RCT5_9GAMM
MTRFHDNRLRYLAEAVRGGTMRAASENLNVAPSSISRQIAQLEEELGVPLIERNRSPLKLTEAGEIALTYYREFTTQQEAFISQVRDLKGLKGGTVCLAVGEGLIGDLLLDVLQRFMSQYPEIRIVMSTAGTADVVSMVLEDEAHMGMVFQPEPDAKIRVRASSDQPMKVIVKAGHPISKRESVTLSELKSERLGLPEQSFRISQMIHSAGSEEHVFLNPVLVSNSLLALKEFARSGLGITILPTIAAHTEIAAGVLAAVPIDNPELMQTSASVITRLGRQLPVGAVRLLQKIEATMPFLPAP